jgi:Protein of unknown function (DUF992)
MREWRSPCAEQICEYLRCLEGIPRQKAMIMSYGKLVASIMVAFAATSASAQEARTNFGLLTCAVDKAQKQPVALKGPTQPVTCTFKPTAAGAEENYIGTVHHTGAGKELLTGKLVLMWVVTAPANTKPSRGWLEQSYIADSAPSTSTVRLFVGQTHRTIVLQLEMDPNVPGGQRFSVSRVDLKLTAIPAGTTHGPRK